MKKLRVLLADDHQVVRDGLRLLIDGQRDMRVVGEAGNGKEALRQALDLKPEVVVMDLSMPELNGLQTTERLKAERPEIKVVAENGGVRGGVGEPGSVLRDPCFDDGASKNVRLSGTDPVLKFTAADPLRLMIVSNQDIVAQHTFTIIIGRSAPLQMK